MGIISWIALGTTTGILANALSLLIALHPDASRRAI